MRTRLGQISIAGLAATSCFASSGCVGLNEDTRKTVENTGKSLENTAAQLADGLKGFDLVGLKALLSENKNLRDKLTEISGRLAGVTDSPVIVLEGQQLQLHFPAYSGGLRVSAWLDSRNNMVLDDKALSRPDRSLKLKKALDYLVDHKDYEKTRGAIFTSPGAVVGGVAPFSKLLKDYDSYVQAQFRALEEATNPVPGDKAPEPYVLNQSLLTSGAHVLFLEVTPISLDSSGCWSISGQIKAASPNNRQQLLKEFNRQSKSGLGKGHVLGQALAPVEITFQVETRGPPQ